MNPLLLTLICLPTLLMGYFEVDLRTRQGQGIGYEEGYSTLTGFMSGNSEARTLGFLDGRVHLLDDGNGAANLGGGFRLLVADGMAIGLNSYFDYHHHNRGEVYQVGAGAEFLSCYFDFRINGYLPLSHSASHRRSSCFYEGEFRVKVRQRRYTLKGGDAEIGKSFCFWNNGWYLALGGYVLNDHKSTTFGGFQGRLALQPTSWDNVQLQLSGSHDSYFHTQMQIELAFSFPVCGCPTSCCPSFTQPVQRHEIIALGKNHRIYSWNY